MNRAEIIQNIASRFLDGPFQVPVSPVTYEEKKAWKQAINVCRIGTKE